MHKSKHPVHRLGGRWQSFLFLPEIDPGINTNHDQKRKRDMNWDQIEGKWKEMSGNVKARWGDLTDDELTEIGGNRDVLEGKIQAKYGKSKEEAREEVNRFLAEH